ncbi:hypothetical protein N9W62_07520 [Akkermansiaceae bacterium]|nr:hypothetical protein [Akkermansiaceae bacterium]
MSPLVRSIIMAAIATLPAGAAVDFAKDLVLVREQKSLSYHNPNLSKSDLSEVLDFDEEMIVKGRDTKKGEALTDVHGGVIRNTLA